MIYFRGIAPIAGRDDVWFSEVQVKNLTSARRDKLVTLLNSAGFTLRDNGEEMVINEIVDASGIYKMRVS
jgi:hypothetical protein